VAFGATTADRHLQKVPTRDGKGADSRQ